MTVIKFLLSFLGIFSIFSGTSQSRTEPFKNCNRIIITNSNDGKTNYKTVITTLLEHGYLIDKKDNEYFTVTTQPKNNKNGTSYVFNFLNKDSAIILSGVFDTHMEVNVRGMVAKSSPETITNKGMYISEWQHSFLAMQKLAILFPGTITYDKQ